MKEEGSYVILAVFQSFTLSKNKTDGEALLFINAVHSATGANQSAVADDIDDDGGQSQHASLCFLVIWTDARERVWTNAPLASPQLHWSPNQ